MICWWAFMILLFCDCFLSFLGEQLEFLSNRRRVYLLPGGCLNVSAINCRNLDYIAESIHLALTSSLWPRSFISIQNLCQTGLHNEFGPFKCFIKMFLFKLSVIMMLLKKGMFMFPVLCCVGHIRRSAVSCGVIFLFSLFTLRVDWGVYLYILTLHMWNVNRR